MEVFVGQMGFLRNLPKLRFDIKKFVILSHELFNTIGIL